MPPLPPLPPSPPLAPSSLTGPRTSAKLPGPNAPPVLGVVLVIVPPEDLNEPTPPSPPVDGGWKKSAYPSPPPPPPPPPKPPLPPWPPFPPLPPTAWFPASDTFVSVTSLPLAIASAPPCAALPALPAVPSDPVFPAAPAAPGVPPSFGRAPVTPPLPPTPAAPSGPSVPSSPDFGVTRPSISVMFSRTTVPPATVAIWLCLLPEIAMTLPPSIVVPAGTASGDVTLIVPAQENVIAPPPATALRSADSVQELTTVPLVARAGEASGMSRPRPASSTRPPQPASAVSVDVSAQPAT